MGQSFSLSRCYTMRWQNGMQLLSIRRQDSDSKILTGLCPQGAKLQLQARMEDENTVRRVAPDSITTIAVRFHLLKHVLKDMRVRGRVRHPWESIGKTLCPYRGKQR